MFSINFLNLLYSAQNDPRKLGYYSNAATVLEWLDKLIEKELSKPQRMETIECQLIQELTKECKKV